MAWSKSLYKYYDRRQWAEKFMDGELLFRTLSFYCAYEEDQIRGDRHEGIALFKPGGGVVINNLTQGTTFTIPHSAFASVAKQDEIFIFCLSRSFTKAIGVEFRAVSYIEVLDIPALCTRVKAALPASSAFFGARVEYYQAAESGNPRWALPDKIATSKLDRYAPQREFRLVFSLTDALEFENVAPHLVQGASLPTTAKIGERLVKIGSLSDICRLHDL